MIYMNSSQVTATIEALVVKVRTYNATCSSTGTPARNGSKVVNGHMIDVRIVGWGKGDQDVTVTVDRRTAPLTIAEAVARVAA